MRPRLVLPRPTRRRILKLDRRSPCPDQRIRCRVILKVAAGRSCNAAARELGCVPSTAVRIVARFQREGEAALLDGRLDNGARKIDADVRGGVAEILAGTPEDHGYTRPTWTLEILRAVVAAVLGVALSLGALWTLLRRLGVRWGRPRAVVACPWRTRRRQRRIAALRALAAAATDRNVVVFADEVDIHLNPKIGADWMLPGHAAAGGHARQQREALPRRRLRAAPRPAGLRRGRPQGQLAVPQPAPGAARELPRGRDDPRDPRQLRHPQEPAGAGMAGRVRREASPALPTTVLPGGEPDRAGLA